jgi:hypothetical protein
MEGSERKPNWLEKAAHATQYTKKAHRFSPADGIIGMWADISKIPPGWHDEFAPFAARSIKWKKEHPAPTCSPAHLHFNLSRRNQG